MKKPNFERINIIFPEKIAEQLRKVPAGKRSQLVANATKKVLQEKTREGIYERLLKLRKGQKPLLPGTIVKWVREDRESH